MFDHILFPTDGSEGAMAVTDHVFALAERHGAMVHVINVADTTHDSVTRIGGEVIDVLEREGGRIVADTVERAEDRSVSTTTEVLQGRVPETIIEYAREYDIDLIVMPTHGRTGFERLLLGSVTERVVRRAPVPVLTLHSDAGGERQHPYRRLLVPTDGSACADAALDVGIDVASAYAVPLHVLSVVDITSLGIDLHSVVQAEELEAQATQDVDEARAAAERAGVESVGTVEHGTSIHRVILAYVDEHDIDLVVMGTHGRTGVDRYVLGSVTEKVVRTAPVPVLTVPATSAGE